MSETASLVVTIDETGADEGGPTTGTTLSADGHRMSVQSTPAIAVVHGVATILEREMDALEPLANTVDPDALNQLVETWVETGADAAMVSFEYCGCAVTVYGSGDIVFAEDGRVEAGERSETTTDSTE